MDAFNRQVHDFSLLMQEELLKHWNQMPPRPTNVTAAVEFTEAFLLCPTVEAARTCIRRNFPGALNFVMALNQVSESISTGRFKLPAEWPEYQTPFYMLGCAILDYIESLPSPAKSAPASQPVWLQPQQH